MRINELRTTSNFFGLDQQDLQDLPLKSYRVNPVKEQRNIIYINYIAYQHNLLSGDGCDE
jgi:hypothetical protein